MKAAIREWGYLLTIPVRLKIGKSGSPSLVNARKMPWEDQQSALDTFKDVFDNNNEPLFIYPFAERQRSGVKFSGMFYFNNQPIFQNSARLYSRGLLVDAENTHIIPTYAPFVYCVVECPSLNVDLARRNPENDAAYRSLCAAVHHEFTDAFEKFAKSQVDSLISLWPAVDNTTISRLINLLDTESERLKLQRDAAEDFVLRCAMYLPFYLLDEISGGQGRPIWKTIDEVVAIKKNNPEANYAPGDIVEVPYTESKVAVEKDILIDRYHELIDVGREGKAHGVLLRVMTRYNEKFAEIHRFRIVPVVLPEADEVTPQEINELWQKTIDMIYHNVSFYKRDHEVVVERITPEDTPIIIGMQDVDEDLVETLRTQLRDAGVAGTQAANLMSKLDGLLGKLSKSGGQIRIRINAENPTMKFLAKATLQDNTLTEAELSLRTITWRAVLDYFGITASRDMIAQERINIDRLVTALINRAERLANVEEHNSGLSARIAQFEAIHKEDLGEQMGVAEPVWRHVGVVDIADSTRKIFGNPGADSTEKARFLSIIISKISEQLDPIATITSFTGDGIQFVVRDDLEAAERRMVGQKLRALENSIREVLLPDQSLNDFLQNVAGGVIKLRIAVDYGEIYRGRVGQTAEHFGLPFIYATRMVSNSELYSDKKVNLMLTDRAYNKGAQEQYWQAGHFGNSSTMTAKGLDDITCYLPI
uniref:Uncharacterized protein n=3 Tax=Candidatus Kentrum eta TaxID=2126337 RepID=A0A450UP36_9GAMM|nr:MAG: hypothetical protein BECKH772B_GA0070898_100591 [Candidatus Kentron sp. H]